MNRFKNLKAKTLSLSLVIATAASVMAPMTTYAADEPTPVPPTSAITADANVATVAAHRAAETAPQILGANLTTMQTSVNNLATAKASNVLNVYGSSWNVAPDPYLSNFYFNMNAGEEGSGLTPTSVNVVALMQSAVPPMGADGSGVSSSTNPDIYLGDEENNGYTYPDSYNTVSYNCGDLVALTDTMYELAYAMNAVPRQAGTYSGRYGNPVAIAKDYEKYIKGVQFNVLSNLQSELDADIEAALEDDPEADVSNFKLENYMKHVAIVKANSDGTYTLMTSSMSSGTAASCRAAEYLEGTTYNVAQDFTDPTKVTAAQLKSSGADYIFTIGVQGQSNNGLSKDTLDDANALPAGAVVVDKMPKYVYGISMNSAENALGVGIFQSIVYDEYLEMEDAVAYFYKDFYHLNDNMIDKVADYYCEDLVDYGYEETKYSVSTINNAITAYTSVLNIGMGYGEENDFSGTKLEITDNYYD